MAKILILDDDASFLRTSALMLRRIGNECFTVESPSEAIQLFHRIRPDLCIFDINFPLSASKNGVQVFEELKVTYPSLRVVFVSCQSQYDPGYLSRRGAMALIDKTTFYDYVSESLADDCRLPHVLLIDNDLAFSYGAKRLLRAKDVSAATLDDHNVQEQVLQCDFSHFDAIIIDVMLDRARSYYAWQVLEQIPPSYPRHRLFIVTGRGLNDIQPVMQNTFSCDHLGRLLAQVCRIEERNVLLKSDKGWIDIVVRSLNAGKLNVDGCNN